MRTYLWIPLIGAVLMAPPAGAVEPLLDLEAATPQSVARLSAAQVEQLRQAASDLEAWVADQHWTDGNEPFKPDDVLETVRQVIETKNRVDATLARTWPLRTEFAERGANGPREDLSRYLRTTSLLIDLSGRIRYFLRDLIDEATYDLDPHPAKFAALIEMLTEHRVEIGAAALSYTLLDPPAESGAVPFPLATKASVLQLLAATRDMTLLPDLVTMLDQSTTTPELLILAVDVIRHTGLPQDSRPGSDPTLPKPVITAEVLKQRLAALDPRGLAVAWRARHRELLEWLSVRAERGVVEDRYRVGDFEVQSGDWLLMRNPSPYNLFTDIAPGLFTHVGVVATEIGSDGKRRFVIVDLPERGDWIPATNVDTYLLRTLHYMFVRHKDPAVQNQLGQAAADMIGNETQFDLTFRTSRVLELKGKPLKGAKIHTYCAGFLLLCAQTTTAPRAEFFPVPEYAAGGNCSANLEKLGVAIGDDFVSPSGAIFSAALEITGRREPMYSPDREVKETVYDHFAESMIKKTLVPSPDLRQALREKLARAASGNRLLAMALARLNNVGPEMDLESAARAAAVVETLDEIADANMNEFLAARAAFDAGPIEMLIASGLSAERIANIRALRQRHIPLWTAWEAGELTPRDLRVALVDYYSQRGREQLDARFFHQRPPE